VLYFQRDSVSPSVWHWSPNIDTGLTATELHTRVSLQQLGQTELLTANGLMTAATTQESLISEQRALVFFYLHTEWHYYEPLIKTLLRSSQIVALLTVILIALWVSTSTGRPIFTVMIVFTALLGLVLFSSLMLKALSLRTVLTMLITLQFGPSANRAVDYAGLSAVTGAAFGLLLLGLLHLPTRPSCPECHRNVNEDYRYCPFCNFVLKRNCARCAAPVDTRWNYCPSCSEDI
jgi:RNA polymerase subunit RPABC4/transcription elongation factor Spt4